MKLRIHLKDVTEKLGDILAEEEISDNALESQTCEMQIDLSADETSQSGENVQEQEASEPRTEEDIVGKLINF